MALNSLYNVLIYS